LVVLLHGYASGPDDLKYVQKAVTAVRPNADLFVPTMPVGRLSTADPLDIVQGLLDSIDRLDSAKGPEGYERITLIGHSLGGLLARKLYICAWGEIEDAPFEPVIRSGEQRTWVNRVDRIILLAGMNRGWSITSHLPLYLSIYIAIGTWLARFLSWICFKENIALRVYRGSPFVTQLRIQWLSMIRQASRDNRRVALTIQLLGSIDDIVAPDDNVDLTTGSEFVYLDVPNSGHNSVVQMDESRDGLARREVFSQALAGDSIELRKKSLQPSEYQLRRDECVKHVVFVVHGIRDRGYWTQKIARQVMARWKQKQVGSQSEFASVTSSYGYFALLPFLMPFQRKEKVHWLMDQYVEAMSRYPNADFYYIGHSNGTYLVARALLDNPCCRFKQIVFAGSVVRTDYDWARLQKVPTLRNGNSGLPQVDGILNYVATSDWVVAFFPKALEMLQLQDLGSAGHDGFIQLNQKRAHGVQVAYVRGDHGAALREVHWQDIAQFVVEKEVPSAKELISPRPSRLIKCVGWICPMVWLGILALAIGIWWGLMLVIGNPFWCGAVTVAYCWAVSRLLFSF